MVGGHILLLTFPAQGHINPALQFAKRLINLGMTVTFATSFSAQRRFSTTKTPPGLTYAAFSDGFDDGFKHGKDDIHTYMLELKSNGSRTLKEIIAASADEGRPVTCLVYTLLLPWADQVARDCHIPAALLWIQPAMVLDMYYYYFNGFKDVIAGSSNDPSWSMKLPNLPLSLSARDLPSFLLPQSSETELAYKFALPTFKEQLDTLDREANPKILVNTFDALEPDALKAIEKYNMIAIGPLIPSAFLDMKDPTDTSFGGDLFKKSSDYLDWLNSKPESSVIYVSFGSILELPKNQMEEIASGLLGCERPFLWVIREKKKETDQEEEEEQANDLIEYMDELEKNGMIIPWCSQLEVLSHPSLGCFVTHCGWNSTLESLASGVPTVAFPKWTDQGTNAKLIEDVWETGVRVRESGEGIVEGGEIKRCIEMVMGEEGFVRRENAKRWKDLARKAVEEGGSSDINLKAFVEEIANQSVA